MTLAHAAQSPTGYQLSSSTISEPVEMTSTEAAEKGEKLAQQILDHNYTDGEFIEITDDVLDELQSLYGNDPDVLSAFYAKLGPQTQLMPSLLEGSGATDSTQIEKLSRRWHSP